MGVVQFKMEEVQFKMEVVQFKMGIVQFYVSLTIQLNIGYLFTYI